MRVREDIVTRISRLRLVFLRISRAKPVNFTLEFTLMKMMIYCASEMFYNQTHCTANTRHGRFLPDKRKKCDFQRLESRPRRREFTGESTIFVSQVPDGLIVLRHVRAYKSNVRPAGRRVALRTLCG